MALPLPDQRRMCHRCAFEQSCRDLVSSGACQRWQNVRGVHPQTGEALDHWDCIDDLTPLLLLDIGKLTREAGKATESLRNVLIGPRITVDERYKEITP